MEDLNLSTKDFNRRTIESTISSKQVIELVVDPRDYRR